MVRLDYIWSGWIKDGQAGLNMVRLDNIIMARLDYIWSGWIKYGRAG